MIGVGVPSTRNRTYRANGLVSPGSFTKGNRGSWGASALGVAARPTVGLAERGEIVSARRPWRDLPEARVEVISRPVVCPGCGIVPPSGRTSQGPVKCPNCW
jgi:hypothetical protein